MGIWNAKEDILIKRGNVTSKIGAIASVGSWNRARVGSIESCWGRDTVVQEGEEHEKPYGKA